MIQLQTSRPFTIFRVTFRYLKNFLCFPIYYKSIFNRYGAHKRILHSLAPRNPSSERALRVFLGRRFSN